MSKMVKAAERASLDLRIPCHNKWCQLFSRAAAIFMADDLPVGDVSVSIDRHTDLVVAALGVPRVRVMSALRSLADDMNNISAILEQQRAGLSEECFANGSTGYNFFLAPNGSHLAVRVPANSPAINITWLIALALRRSVLLCANPTEPFTPLRLIESLARAGLPDGSVSLVLDDQAPLAGMADQVLWAGDLPSFIVPTARRVKTYHQGRSKAVAFDNQWMHAIPDLVRMSISGAGRLCTNLSGLLVVGDATPVAKALARELGRIEIRDLDDPLAIIPAVRDRSIAEAIDDEIRAAEGRGAIDLVGEIVRTPRLVQRGDKWFIRPVVLLIDIEDRMFGAELPFPFVTVASAHERDVIPRCRGSLIVSLIGARDDLIIKACCDPGIDKIFSGSEIARGYSSLDPHEGFLSDFLFTKKAVVPLPR